MLNNNAFVTWRDTVCDLGIKNQIASLKGTISIIKPELTLFPLEMQFDVDFYKKYAYSVIYRD